MALTKIRTEHSIEAQGLFVGGYSLAEISEQFPQYSRNQWRTLKQNNNWDQEKERYEQELKLTASQRLKNSKEQFINSLNLLTRQCQDKVRKGKIRLDTMSDVEKLFQMVGSCLKDEEEKEKRGGFSNFSEENTKKIYAILREEATEKAMNEKAMKGL